MSPQLAKIEPATLLLTRPQLEQKKSEIMDALESESKWKQMWMILCIVLGIGLFSLVGDDAKFLILLVSSGFLFVIHSYDSPQVLEMRKEMKQVEEWLRMLDEKREQLHQEKNK